MDVNELKRLWQISFGDSESYVDFYFSRRYSPLNTRICRTDDRIVSSAQFFPYDISLGDKLLKGVYILGVCTHPDYRQRGFAAGIIRGILAEQTASGADIAFLIPSAPYLFEVYRKFGFGELFTIYERNVESVSAYKPYELMKPGTDEIYTFYNRFYRSLNSAVLKTYDDFMFALEDVVISGGRIDVCGIDGEIHGFAATEGSVVKELLCLDEAARDTLISALLADTAGRKLTVITPTPEPGAVKKALGMARALQPEGLGANTKESYANLLLN